LLIQAQLFRDAEKVVSQPIAEKEPETADKKIVFQKEYLLTSDIVKECDAVVHVIDVRDPIAGRMKELETKNTLFVLTKIGI
jgi:ribosome biogenesis GTPase A